MGGGIVINTEGNVCKKTWGKKGCPEKREMRIEIRGKGGKTGYFWQKQRDE